jgi:autotransporter translocation and assembly factor TamB
MGDLSGEIDKFTVKLSGAADALNGTVEFSAPALGAFGYSVTNSAAQVKINPKAATVSAKSNFEGAPITAQGTVTDYMTSPKLNISGNLRSFNLAKAAALVPELKDLALAGTVNADVTVKGTAAVPEITGKAWSDKLTAMKETVETPAVSFALKGKTVNITGASAKWRGSSLSGSGTVGADGKLNLKASLENLQPGAIAPFYPDIAQYKIKGAVTAGATVTGTTAAPKIDLSLTSGSLGLLDMATFKNLKVGTTLAGDRSH